MGVRADAGVAAGGADGGPPRWGAPDPRPQPDHRLSLSRLGLGARGARRTSPAAASRDSRSATSPTSTAARSGWRRCRAAASTRRSCRAISRPPDMPASFAPTHACCSALRPTCRCSDRRSQTRCATRPGSRASSRTRARTLGSSPRTAIRTPPAPHQGLRTTRRSSACSQSTRRRGPPGRSHAWSSDAHRAGLPFRLTEVNSVTCGGVPGVSDTFATALWAPDTLFELLRAGVDGVNVHVRTDAINAAFAFKRSGLVARPLLYGLRDVPPRAGDRSASGARPGASHAAAAREGVGGCGRGWRAATCW